MKKNIYNDIENFPSIDFFQLILFLGFRLYSKAHFGIADELHCAAAKDSGIGPDLFFSQHPKEKKKKH